MKIISKYKDFYDSYGFILGKPDESITYVRTTEVIDDDNKQYKSIIKKLYDYGHLYFHVYGFKEDYNGKDKEFTVVELNDGAFIIKSNRRGVYEKS